MRDQLRKAIPSPVVLGQISEKFREAVKALAEQEDIPMYQFRHKERKDDVANRFPIIYIPRLRASRGDHLDPR